MGKRKNKIRIRFVGGNSEDVTGSCNLIEMDGCKILLECGLYQSNNLKNDYKINNRRLDFKPSEIDYIFLNHLHIDHSGLIPRLFAQGCKARIIAPKGSKELFKIMCTDSAFIMGKDVETLQRKYKIEANQIYTTENVVESLKYFQEYDFKETIKLNDNISFRFVPSGHIINSAQLELWITENNHTKKILYTSDLGNISVPKYYTNQFEPVNLANIVIAECTYGDSSRFCSMKDRIKDLEKIKSVVETVCIDSKHKVLIPIFALDRSQNILTYLYDLFGNDPSFNIPIIIDSPLTCKIFEMYQTLLDGEQFDKFEEVVAWKNVKFIKEYTDSLEWQSKKEPAIILSAGGFLQAGRARSWVKTLLPNARNHILFVGYSSPTSLAGKIKDGKNQKTISIDGKPIPNRCGITNLMSFTSHIQYDDMLKYYSDIRCEKLCLVHGEFKGKCKFAKELQDEISRKNKTSKVIAVNSGAEILL